MSWSKQLSQLRDALATQIPFREDVLPFLTEAGINFQNIQLSQVSLTLWHNILSYANNNAKLDDLVKVLLLHFPENPHLISFEQQITYSLGEEIKETEWKAAADPKTLEKITGTTSTLLPISFLETGLKRAKSVARVLIKRANGTEAGTGFLLANNLFVTNNHVIADIATAEIAKLQFDYELSIAGVPMLPTEFMLDPAKGFATSVKEDWTAVRVKGDANTQFGTIELKEATITKNDFVNIIQHPGGLYKQLGMYHNMVTYCDNNIVQYLTDTEPGSSGAPVFNSQWDIVALHHSGGMLREPGTKQTLLRNEGIHINVVMAGIKANNL